MKTLIFADIQFSYIIWIYCRQYIVMFGLTDLPLFI